MTRSMTPEEMHALVARPQPVRAHQLLGDFWEPMKQMRWLRQPNTTTEPDKLQQLWREHFTGKFEWRDVPVEIATP